MQKREKCRTDDASKIMIRYGRQTDTNGIHLCLTEIFPNEQVILDWYEA